VNRLVELYKEKKPANKKTINNKKQLTKILKFQKKMNSNNPTHKKPTFPFSPSLKQLLHFYAPNQTNNYVISLYQQSKKEKPVNSGLKQPKSLTQKQLFFFLKEIGYPKGYTKEDFPQFPDIIEL
jgi:hypothetical protein